MRAVLFKNRKISIIEKSVPDIGKGEILVKTLAAGICSTDIELFNGYYGFEDVAGHEFVGIVEKSPEKPEL